MSFPFHRIFQFQSIHKNITPLVLVPVAARSKMYVCGRSPPEIMGSHPARSMDVFFFVSGRGLCGELIIRPEESYQLYCVVVCDTENS